MKKLILALVFVCYSALASPTIHLGSGLVLHFDYRFAEWTVESVTVQYYQTTLKLDPIYGTGYSEWCVWKPDAFFDVFPIQNSDAATGVWHSIDYYWNNPIVHLPTGNQWVTNQWCLVWLAQYGPNDPSSDLTVSFELTPYSVGDYWIYQTRKGIVMKKGKQPRDFQ